MFNKIILYWLLLLITITATLGRNDRLKVSRDEIVNRISKHGLKQPCCGHFIKSGAQKIKNYKEVIINYFGISLLIIKLE